MASITAPELLKLQETEFDEKIKDMPLQKLLEIVGVLQKEMSREQENFNSLSSELGTLKKNSAQYKSVAKEMTASQAKLTMLMNRSMKCFSQSNQQNKSSVDRRNSFHETSKHQTVPDRTSAPVQPASVIQSNIPKTEDQSKVNSDSAAVQKTTVQVQSLKPSKPVVEINGSHLNGEAKKDVKMKLEQSLGGKLDAEQTRKAEDKMKPELMNNTNTHLGPMAGQKKFMSRSSDNVYQTSTEPPKPEVVKGKVPVKPKTVVMNADKQMIDLDSFTDRKNMLNELKKFDKVLKPSASSAHTEKVTEVKVNVAKPGDKRASGHGENDTDPNITEQKLNVLGDIKLGMKPSELKQAKKPVSKAEDNTDGVNANTVKSVNENQKVSQTKLFDSLLEDVGNQSESSAESSPREVTESVEVLEVPASAPTLKSSRLPAFGEVTVSVEEGAEGVKDGEEENVEESPEEVSDEEDDKFVTEFHFTGTNIKNRQTTTKAVPKKEEDKKQHDTKSSQPSAKVEASGGTGIHGNKDDEELVVDTKVKFREWDPVKLLSKLYEVKMMPDNVEDISHKFIGMEGLMEKLPMNKKKATLLKTWKRRFFRAQDGWLHYYESGNKDKPSDSLQLMGGKVEELGPRVLGVDDGRGKYLMVRVPTDHEYGLWKVALESQTADNVKATYVRPAPASIPHPKKKVVVIDIGSCSIRAGILGERATLPQVFFPCLVAVNKQTGEIIVGSDAWKPEVRRCSSVVQPIQPTNKVDKFNIDMSVMTEIFRKVFRDLQVDQSQYLVMLSTPQNLGDKLKEGLIRILIDNLHVRGVCMVQQSLLALYSYSATSGIIVDIGERLEILPIYEGLLIEGGVSRQAYGGSKVQDSLFISLLENEYKFNTPVEKLLVRYICEQACYVTDNYSAAKEKCDKNPADFTTELDFSKFDLPEGAYQKVQLDYARFKSPEGFFNTDLWEMDYKNIQKQIYGAIQQCPMDARKHMYRSVYLSGGVTSIPGFAERLQEELRKLAPPAALVEVHASPQRYHSAYIGACAVAGMDVFEMSCVSAEEWKKLGIKACKKWGTG